MSVIEKIENLQDSFTEESIVTMMPQILRHYEAKIRNQSYMLYSSNLGFRAYECTVSLAIHKAIKNFMIDNKLYQSRQLDPYLRTTINNTFLREKSSLSGKKAVTKPMCQACAYYGERSVLYKQNGYYHCQSCSKDEFSSNEEAQFRKVFAHIKLSGFRCTSCDKFLPRGLKFCPYPNCSYFGSFKKKLHCPRGRDAESVMFTDNIQVFDANNFEQPQEQSVDSEIESLNALVNEVIDFNLRKLKRLTPHKVLKIFMMQAYKNIVEKNQNDMIAYLVYKRAFIAEQSLQAMIFQEFVSIIENNLPIVYKKNEIYSIADPKLGLFWCKSEYPSIVIDGGVIYNETREHYIGSSTIKDYGPCFIGRLISIEANGIDVTDRVTKYQFSKIMTDLEDGTEVIVKHFALPSHWEIGKMVLLQQARNILVEDIEKRRKK